MSITDQAMALSKAEKLRLMDALWRDLSRSPEELESPEWHRHELEATEQLIAEGKVEFVDWFEAKERLRNQ